MRIKNSRNRNIGIIGKIKVGDTIERKGKKIPCSLDYFRATSENSYALNSFERLYPKKSELLICFSGDNDDFNTDHRFEVRNNQGKVYCYGDGQDFYISNGKEMRLLEYDTIVSKYGSPALFMEKTEQYLSTDRYKAAFKEVLTLRFIIANIPIIGVWQLQTHAAKSSIDQILGNYDHIKNLNGGSLNQVPFLLGVKKVIGNSAMDFNRSYPVISLTPFAPELAQENMQIESIGTNLLNE